MKIEAVKQLVALFTKALSRVILTNGLVTLSVQICIEEGVFSRYGILL